MFSRHTLVCRNNITALLGAADKGYESTVRLLFEHKADVTVVSR